MDDGRRGARGYPRISIRASPIAAFILAITVICTPFVAQANQLEVYVQGEVFGDKRVVEAFRVAVDGQRVLEAGDLAPNSAIMFRRPNSSSTETSWRKYDPKASLQWLAEAGFEKGLKIRLHYWREQPALARIMITYLTKSGFLVDGQSSSSSSEALVWATNEARKGLATVYVFAKAETRSAVPTPDLRGMEPADAYNQYPNIKFRIVTGGTRQSTLGKGMIVEQDPMPGVPLPRDGKIAVWLSEGMSDDVYLLTPNLKGLKPAQTRSRYPNLKFSLANMGTIPSDLPEGTIADQKPGPNQRMPNGGRIEIWLSDGPVSEVPKIIGWIEADARSLIERKRLRFQVTGREYSQQPMGHISRQEPIGGSKVPVGTTVQAWLSAGPEPKEVPDIIGWTEADARNAIESRSLRFQTMRREYSKHPAGRIARQHPASGSKVSAGTTVQAWLSAGPRPPPPQPRVPNLLGKHPKEAENLLQQVELRLRVIGEDYSEAQPAGRVYWQDPPGNKLYPAGSIVRVRLSKGKPWWLHPFAWIVGGGVLLIAGIAIRKTLGRRSSGPNPPKVTVRRRPARGEQEIYVENNSAAAGPAVSLRMRMDRGQQEIHELGNEDEN